MSMKKLKLKGYLFQSQDVLHARSPRKFLLLFRCLSFCIAGLESWVHFRYICIFVVQLHEGWLERKANRMNQARK